jgi:hypothetical protein
MKTVQSKYYAWPRHCGKRGTCPNEYSVSGASTYRSTQFPLGSRFYRAPGVSLNYGFAWSASICARFAAFQLKSINRVITHQRKIILRTSVRTKRIMNRAIPRENRAKQLNWMGLTFIALKVWVFPPTHSISSVVAPPTCAKQSFLSSRLSGITCVADLEEFTFLAMAFWLSPSFDVAPCCTFLRRPRIAPHRRSSRRVHSIFRINEDGMWCQCALLQNARQEWIQTWDIHGSRMDVDHAWLQNDGIPFLQASPRVLFQLESLHSFYSFVESSFFQISSRKRHNVEYEMSESNI